MVWGWWCSGGEEERSLLNVTMAICFFSLDVVLLMVVCQDRLSNCLRLCPEIVSEKKIDFTKSLAACEISNFLSEDLWLLIAEFIRRCETVL